MGRYDRYGIPPATPHQLVMTELEMYGMSKHAQSMLDNPDNDFTALELVEINKLIDAEANADAYDEASYDRLQDEHDRFMEKTR